MIKGWYIISLYSFVPGISPHELLSPYLEELDCCQIIWQKAVFCLPAARAESRVRRGSSRKQQGSEHPMHQSSVIDLNDKIHPQEQQPIHVRIPDVQAADVPLHSPSP